MEIIIRTGTAADVDSLFALIHELAVFEKAEHEVISTRESLLKDGFSSPPLFEFFVAEVDGAVAGIALTYYKYSTWKGRCLYLEDLIVREEMRGHGIGKKLFEHVLQKATSEGVGRLEWQVLDWNEDAIKFYEKYESEISHEWLNGRISYK